MCDIPAKMYKVYVISSYVLQARPMFLSEVDPDSAPQRSASVAPNQRTDLAHTAARCWTSDYLLNKKYVACG